MGRDVTGTDVVTPKKDRTQKIIEALYDLYDEVDLFSERVYSITGKMRAEKDDPKKRGMLDNAPISTVVEALPFEFNEIKARIEEGFDRIDAVFFVEGETPNEDVKEESNLGARIIISIDGVDRALRYGHKVLAKLTEIDDMPLADSRYIERADNIKEMLEAIPEELKGFVFTIAEFRSVLGDIFIGNGE